MRGADRACGPPLAPVAASVAQQCDRTVSAVGASVATEDEEQQMEHELCDCGCGERAVPPSRYAGCDKSERSKHRMAAKRRKDKQTEQEQEQVQQATAHLQRLAAGDDMSDLLGLFQEQLATTTTLAVLLRHAVGDLTPQAVAEQVTQQTLEARARADELDVELQAVRSQLRQERAATQQAVERAAQADDDAALLAERLDERDQREAQLLQALLVAEAAARSAAAEAHAERAARSKLRQQVHALLQEGLQAGERHARMLDLLNEDS